MKKHLGVFIILISLLFISNSFAGEVEVTLSGGYHVWSQSGHTFAHSDKGDKEWNGVAYQGEVTWWHDYVGWYVYGGKDKQIREKMLESPDRYFKANVWYIGSGIKVRKKFYDWLVAYIGTGLNYTVSEQEYLYSDGRHWAESEDLDNVGPDVLAGVQFVHSSGVFSSLHARYSWNREMSDTFNQTTFDPGGLRVWVGLGYMF